MKLGAFHQFHPTIAYGDAVSGDCFELQRLAWSSGLRAELFAAYAEMEVRSFVRDRGELASAATRDAVLLVHHSMGNDSVDAVAAAPFARKALVYHNITPAEYFAGVSEQHRHYAQLGREQLRRLAGSFELAIADSEFNRQELVQCGYARTAVVPILLDWAAYEADPDPAVLRRLGEERTAIVVVGQILPQKALHDVIAAFDRYRASDAGARLYLVGSTTMSGPYLERLYDDVAKRGLTLAVTFTGRVGFRELLAYYRVASAVLTLSDHEGFCVPLLEAMRFGRPIVAHAAGAVPETLGDAGILLHDKSPERVAEALERAVRDEALRGELALRGHDRLAEFSRDRVAARLASAFASLGWEMPPRRRLGVAVMSSDERCGIHEYAKAVCDGLRADGHDVTFVGVERANSADLARKVSYIPKTTDAVIVEHEAGIFRDLPFIRALWRLRRRGIRVVLSLHELEPEKFHHYRTLRRGVDYRRSYAWPLELVRIPWVAALVAWRFLLYRAVLTLLGALPRRLIVHSQRSLHWVDLLTRDRSKVDHLPLVLMPLEDTALPRDAEEKGRLRERLGLPADRFIFISPGFFFRRKRYLEVIDAAPPGSLVVLSGTAASWELDYFDEVTAYVKERGLEHVVINTDYERMGDHVAASDCVVLYYEDIFQSAVATQAVWAGLPAIYSDVPGFALYRGAGLFASDGRQLREAMREIQDPATYARLRDRVAILRQLLSPERLGPRYLAGLR